MCSPTGERPAKYAFAKARFAIAVRTLNSSRQISPTNKGICNVAKYVGLTPRPSAITFGSVALRPSATVNSTWYSVGTPGKV
jgi:hypothetical protein